MKCIQKVGKKYKFWEVIDRKQIYITIQLPLKDIYAEFITEDILEYISKGLFLRSGLIFV